MATSPTIPTTPQTITIHNADAASGCGACAHSVGASPICQVAMGEARATGKLSGPPDQLNQLLAALAPVLGGPRGNGLVDTLQVQVGEVNLSLALRAECGGAQLADQAFQTLRGLLPDTDIYVTLAR